MSERCLGFSVGSQWDFGLLEINKEIFNGNQLNICRTPTSDSEEGPGRCFSQVVKSPTHIISSILRFDVIEGEGGGIFVEHQAGVRCVGDGDAIKTPGKRSFGQ